MLPPCRQKTRSKGGGLEDHLQIRVHLPAGRRPIAPFTQRAGANANGPRVKLARCSFTGNAPRRFVLRIGPSKASSRRSPALFAGSHRPWLEAKSWAAAFEYRHSFRSRTALGAVKRTVTARVIVPVRGGVENQSRRAGPYQSPRRHQYPSVSRAFFLF